MELTVLERSDVDEAVALKLCTLWLEVWPQAKIASPSDYASKLLAGEVLNQTCESNSERFHLLEDDWTLLAICRSFERKIRFLDSGEERIVLALAGVCCDPNRRGLGYGKTVVESALTRLGGSLETSLFQTGVPAFYQRFGAFLVDNEFVNSRHVTVPSENPWWDKCVMAIGGERNWPTGRIDLLGAAY